jgi:hypothetical protein
MYYVETQRLFNKLEQLKKKTHLIHRLKLEYKTRADLIQLIQLVLNFSQKQVEVFEKKLFAYKNYNPLLRLVFTNHLKEITDLTRENLYNSINPERNRKLLKNSQQLQNLDLNTMEPTTIEDSRMFGRYDLKLDLEHGLVSFEPLLDKDIPDRLKN